MIFRGSKETQSRLCLALFSTCFSLCLVATHLHAAVADGPTDSETWQERFAAWVEAVLVRDEVEEAIRELPEFDQNDTLRVLNRLVLRRVDRIQERPLLPPEIIPPMQARGITGPSLEAARVYARGELEEAIDLIDAPELIGDGDAMHLRAQLMDQYTQGTRAFYRMSTVIDYRYALTLSQQSPQAERARLRIGQILLELRFVREAAAALRPLLKMELEPSQSVAARISYAEAVYLDKRPRAAIEAIGSIQPEELSPKLRRWALRRMADSFFKLRRYPAAVAAYEKVIEESEDGDLVDPLVRLRLASAMMRNVQKKDAEGELRLITPKDSPHQLAGLANLLLARLLREQESFEAAAGLAHEALLLLKRGPNAALAAVEILESTRLDDNGDLALPDEAVPLLDLQATRNEAGLLAYRVARTPAPGTPDKKLRDWLGGLLTTLPEGAVRRLTHDDLADRLLDHMREVHTSGSPPNPEVFEDVERYLRPRMLEENSLLLGVVAAASAGEWSTCARWGQTLSSREVRPVRRGLGAWKMFLCQGRDEQQSVSTYRLKEAADIGTAGPFSLAIAALAAERTLRLIGAEQAVGIYEQALTAVAEPGLIAPVLIRQGELQLEIGETRLGARRLLRGLSLMDRKETAMDPFRKAGIVALARAAATERSNGSNEVASLLRREGERAEPWWRPAYSYLGYRAGIAGSPSGDDLFSRAAVQLQAANRLESRMKKIVGGSSAVRGGQRGNAQ